MKSAHATGGRERLDSRGALAERNNPDGLVSVAGREIVATRAFVISVRTPRTRPSQLARRDVLRSSICAVVLVRRGRVVRRLRLACCAACTGPQQPARRAPPRALRSMLARWEQMRRASGPPAAPWRPPRRVASEAVSSWQPGAGWQRSARWPSAVTAALVVVVRTTTRCCSSDQSALGVAAYCSSAEPTRAMAETEESEPSTPTTRRRKPYGLLHVHCVDVLLDRGCLRTAAAVRLQLGYGAQRQSCAGAVERDDDGSGRAHLRRQAAAFEVKASKHAPRQLTVAVRGRRGPSRGRRDLGRDAAPREREPLSGRTHRPGAPRRDGARRVRVRRPGGAAAAARRGPSWSGLLRPERIYPLAPDERLVVVAVAGDRALVAAGDARVALRRSWLRRTGERAAASTIAALAASPLRRALEDSIERPGAALDRARGGAVRLKDRWRAGGVEAVRGDVLYALGAADGPRGRRGSSRRTRRATSPTRRPRRRTRRSSRPAGARPKSWIQ